MTPPPSDVTAKARRPIPTSTGNRFVDPWLREWQADRRDLEAAERDLAIARQCEAGLREQLRVEEDTHGRLLATARAERDEARKALEMARPYIEAAVSSPAGGTCGLPKGR